MLPLDLKARAMHTARQRGISFGELLRRSLAAAIESPAPTYDDPVFADSAVFEGETPEDLATEHDGHLYGNDG